ncbi:hypothetical protein AJ79_08498 [Helicocarpus griseus UAMH5409]|uniref:Killer toxin Kp4 domain-containing protein n=1 Tax=Helicocarpus griseus UAMH5409 TaxID=1447875 RepID=A0A2B7WSC5_9EURO|nr:hypothetical protein AJ79_08498 [Helicocarpus griseus UAMH5409]
MKFIFTPFLALMLMATTIAQKIVRCNGEFHCRYDFECQESLDCQEKAKIDALHMEHSGRRGDAKLLFKNSHCPRESKVLRSIAGKLAAESHSRSVLAERPETDIQASVPEGRGAVWCALFDLTNQRKLGC